MRDFLMLYPRRAWRFPLLLLVLLFLGACAATGPAPPSEKPLSDYDASLATGWIELELQLIRTTAGYSPPVASRALGYSGVTLYEALVRGMPGHRSLGGQLTGLPPLPEPEAGRTYHWPLVANSAMATLLDRLFATTSAENLAAIAALEARFRTELGDRLSPGTVERSERHGRAVADAIFEWSKGDGGHDAYLAGGATDHESPAGAGLWEPTPPGYYGALHPRWGNNRPFLPSPTSTCDPGPPHAYSEAPGSPFYQEAHEVYETVRALTPEQHDIALYWADDPGRTATPPGHSTMILTQLLHAEHVSLDRAAEAYARMGMVLADSFIGCWGTKYTYNLVRPITYIQRVISPEWNRPNVTDLVITPPFPEYTSGHSVQVGAASVILVDLFGESFAFTDHTHERLGYVPRSYSSFDEMAQEAALSRLYGGIHFRAAIERGVEQGRCIARRLGGVQFRVE